VSSTVAEDWVEAMRAGDFRRAWEISDRELALVCRAGSAKHEGPRHLQRIWRGEPLEGRRVLVRCYHGLGDTIQFARFLSPLRAIAAEVMVWCQPELLPLIAPVEGVDRVLPLQNGKPEVDFDVDIEIMEIPHALRSSHDQVEIRCPYLTAMRGDGAVASAIGSMLAVGLVWGAGEWDARRAIPPSLFKQLACSDVQLYSLQRDDAAGAAREIGAIDISTPDLEVLAARLQSLDFCICPDTMIAHLSAALGCETWVLLHADCDWRWPAAGCRSLWYPTVRLFHQAVPGDWNRVVADVRSALLRKRDCWREGWGRLAGDRDARIG
jgi:hypothetical protein